MSKEKLVRGCDIVMEWCFYAILAAVTFSISIVEIASSLMILVWFIKRTVAGDIKRFDSVPARLLIVLIFWSVLSCFNSQYFKESFRGIFKIAEYAMLFIVAAAEMRKETVVKRSLYVIGVTALVICLDGFFQYFTGTDLIRHRNLIVMDYLRRISSSFVHPNSYGAYLLIVSSIFLAFVIFRRDWKEKGVFGALFGLSILSLYLTRSRGSWISFAVAVLILGAMKAKRMLAVFLVLMVILFMILPYTVQQEVFAAADFKTGTTWERLMLWKGAINMIKVHPLLGFGVNTYTRNFPLFKPEGYPDVRYSHNCYLQMASEIGIPGALIFLIFLMTVLIMSFAGISRMPEGRRKDMARGLFAALCGFSLNSMVDTHLFSVNLAAIFYILLGFLYALSCYGEENRA